jgi:abnormal spindle-like microcephaly-associated protein
LVFQRAFRARLARLFVHRLRCVIFAQALVRRHLARTRYLRSRALAVVSSSVVRAHAARRFLVRSLAARKIQSNVRLCLAVSALHRIDLQLRRLAVAEQVQAASRALIARNELVTKLAAARVIQTVWRAHAVRTRPALAAMAPIRHRLAAATANALPDHAIGQRVESALSVLASPRLYLSALMQACNTLALATLVSYAVADRLVQEGALTHIFRLIRGCNRSTPHQELIKLALDVLENVARQSAYAAVLVEDASYAELLVDLMQMYRDKEQLFMRAVAVPYAVCLRSHQCRALLAQNASLVKRMETVHALVDRKLRLEGQYLQRHTAHMQAHRPYHNSLRDLLALLV